MKTIIEEINDFNEDVSQWAYNTREKLKANLNKATKGKGTLKKGLRTKLRKNFSEIETITYRFPRHGVFYQKGVGRGHVMENGNVVRGIKENKVIRLISGKVNREPRDWFNSTLEKETPKLADTVADHKADQATIAIFKIK